MNVEKTKEVQIYFRKAPAVVRDLFIDDVQAEIATEYKYLGTVIDNKLNFLTKTLTLFTKAVSQEYFAFRS